MRVSDKKATVWPKLGAGEADGSISERVRREHM